MSCCTNPLTSTNQHQSRLRPYDHGGYHNTAGDGRECGSDGGGLLLRKLAVRTGLLRPAVIAPPASERSRPIPTWRASRAPLDLTRQSGNSPVGSVVRRPDKPNPPYHCPGDHAKRGAVTGTRDGPRRWSGRGEAFVVESVRERTVEDWPLAPVGSGGNRESGSHLLVVCRQIRRRCPRLASGVCVNKRGVRRLPNHLFELLPINHSLVDKRRLHCPFRHSEPLCCGGDVVGRW